MRKRQTLWGEVLAVEWDDGQLTVEHRDGSKARYRDVPEDVFNGVAFAHKPVEHLASALDLYERVDE